MMEHVNLTIKVGNFSLHHNKFKVLIFECKKVNSQGCADDYSCIDTQDNYKCILMNPTTSLSVVGRESSTGYCIPGG